MTPRPLRSTSALLALATALALAPAARGQTVVTSLDGELRSGDGSVEALAVVPEDETFETEGDGHCSLMVAGEAVVQLCNAASVTFRRRGRTRVMDLRQGELKATVGPRSGDQPLEIHTPVAIATLLGTVVHVSVDPVTGETTITSLENRVRVQGVEAERLDPIVLEPHQQVTIRRGEAPGAVRRIPDAVNSDVSDCMLPESDLRVSAISAARAQRRQELADQIAAADIPDLTLPAVAASFEAARVADDRVFDRFEDPTVADERPDVQLEDPFTLGVLDVDDAGGGAAGPRPPEVCSGRAGDHCQF